MVGNERLSMLIMYAETLATANKIGAGIGISSVAMPVNPAEALDVMRELQTYRVEIRCLGDH